MPQESTPNSAACDFFIRAEKKKTLLTQFPSINVGILK
jgi:hypothetical protein